MGKLNNNNKNKQVCDGLEKNAEFAFRKEDSKKIQRSFNLD